MRNPIFPWTILLLGNIFALLTAAPVSAQTFENLDRLDALVATTTGAAIGQPGGAIAPVDRRLHLVACPTMPTVEGPVFGGAIVKCDRIGWRIRVPLAIAQPVMQQAAYGRAAPVPQGGRILIRKGDPVQLIAGDAMFSVSKQMIADEDGAVGDVIRLRESKSAPAVAGRVEADGSAHVPGI